MVRRNKHKRKLNSEINVVPYIDVMMVLLVIFMVTAPMLTQGVSVELPSAVAEPVKTEEQEIVIVTVDKDGLFYIDVGGDPKVAISAETLRERVGKLLLSPAKPLLLVRGDKNAKYDSIMQAMSEMKLAGADKVGLVTE